MRKLALFFAFASLLLGSPALAQNYQATAGSGLTFGAKSSASILYPYFIGCDATTPTQCWAVDSSGRLTVNLASGSTVAATQSGTWNLNNISGTISLPTGASTSALQTTGNTSLATIATNSGTQATAANQAAPNTASTTNPTSTLTLPATTTAYNATSGPQLIANSATAGSVVTPSFSIANSAGAAFIPRLRLSTNDSTSTAWSAATIQVDLWSASPTWANGDRAVWQPATGTASHLGSYTCTMSAEYGDGAYAECYPTVGNGVQVRLGSGTSIFWSLQSVNGSGVTGASKVFTLTAELQN